MSRSSSSIKNKTKKNSSPIRIVDHVVHVHIDPQTVSKYVRSGNDLIIYQANGKVIRVHGFFGDGDKQQLELVFDYNGGEFKMAAIPTTIPLDDTTGDEVLFKPVDDNEHKSGSLKAAGLAALAASVVGAAAASTGSGGGSGHSSSNSSSSNGADGMGGINGGNGSNGSNGTNGSNGANGSSGHDGTNGTNGSNGSNGSSGHDGANGTNGSNGANGSSGHDGANGTNGSNGSNGSSGHDGANGSNGTNGSNGNNGHDGADGTNGTNGHDGANGTNGTNADNTPAPNAPTLFFKSNPDGTVTGSGQTIANGQVRVTFPDGTSQVVVADGQGNYQAKSHNVQDSGQGSAIVTDSHGKSSLAAISSYTDDVRPNAATVSGGKDHQEPVVGDFKNQDYINDARPEIHGSGAEARALIRIYNGTTEIGTTYADANGNWSWQPTTNLSDGTYKITVKVVDKAGNESDLSNEFQFTIQTAQPKAVKIDSIHTGADDSKTDGTETREVINKKRPTIEGSDASIDGVVYVYAKSSDGETKLLGTTIAGPDGKWSFVPSVDLKDDSYIITANLIDKAGNVGHISDGFAIKVDTIAPNPPVFDKYMDNTGSITGEVASKHSTDEQHPILRGHGAEKGSVVTIYDTYNGTKTAIGTTVAKDDGSWEFDCGRQKVPVTFGEGDHKITVTSTNAAKNSSNESAPFEVTVDLTAPTNKVTIDQVQDDQQPQTGTVLNNGYTNDRTPILVGSNAEANGIVRIYVKNANNGYDYVGETVADGSGHWSYTVASLPKDGSYIYQARATDAAGNEAVGSNDFAINLDTIAPVVPSIVKVEKPAGDEILQGKPTNTTTPTITGTSEKDAIINIYDVNGGWIGSTTADGQGHWSFTPTSQMPAGMHNLYTTATDAAGNVSGQSARFPFEINLQKPTTPTISRIENDDQKTVNQDGYTNDHTPKLYGRGDAGTEITISVLMPGSKDPVVIGTVTVNPDGYWEFQAPYYANDGLYKFLVKATNAAGNDSDTNNYNVNLDFKAPDQPTISEVRSTLPPKSGPVDDNGTTNDPAPMISGTAEKDSQILIYRNGQADPYIVKADGQGHWSFRVPGLDDGTYTFRVFAVDQAGNKSATPTTRTVKILTSYPDAPVIQGADSDVPGSAGEIKNNQYTRDDTPTLHGTSKPKAIIHIYDGNKLIGTTQAGDDKDGSWTFKIDPTHPLENNQSHTLTARIADDAGKESNPSQPWVVNVDHTAPDVPKIVGGRDTASSIANEFSNGDFVKDKHPTIHGEGAEPYSLVKIYDASGNVVGTVKADAAGQWKWTSTTDLSDGSYSYKASVVDQAGNESNKSDSFTFTVLSSNSQIPVISDIINDNDGKSVSVNDTAWTNDDTPTLHGTNALKNGIVRIYDNGKLIGAVKAGPDGSWSFKTDPLVGQNHRFTACTVDAAGNESTLSTKYDIKVDTVAPNQPIINRVEDSNHDTVVNGGYTNSHAPKLYGRAEKNADVLVYGTLPGSDKPTLLGTVKANEDGYWEFQTPSYNTDGFYKFTVQAKDAAGNLSDTTDYGVNLDFVPPAQPKITEVRSAVLPKPGPVVDTGTTNDPAPFIMGEAEKNSQVLIYIKGQSEPIGVVKADGQGHWSFRIPGLNDGNYSFEVYSVDQAGNKSQTPATYNITVMTSYPDAPVIKGADSDVPGSVGEIKNNQYTKDDTPTLHGTSKPNAIIRIYDGTKLIGTTKAGDDKDGSWTFTVDPNHPLEDNQTHTLVARIFDDAGKESNPSQPWVVNVDHTAPDAPSIVVGRDVVSSSTHEFNNGATINDKQPVLRGEGAEAYSTVKIYDASGNVVGTVKADAGGQWKWTPTIDKDGDYSYRAAVVDQAGNESDKSAAFGFTVKSSNAQVPTISKIISSAGDEPTTADGVNWVNKDVVTIQGGGAIKDGIVRIYDNGKQIGEVTAGPDGSWSFKTDPLIGQNHSFTAKTVDAAGNESSISNVYDIKIDTVAPNPPVFDKYMDNTGSITGEVASKHSTDEQHPILRGHGAEKGSVVTIYDTYNGTKTAIGTTVAKDDGSWEFDCGRQKVPVTFGEGDHKITVTSTNAAKNSSNESAPFEVTVDLTAPTNKVTIDQVQDDQQPQTGTVLNNGYTNDRTPILVGSNAEANGIVRIYVKNANNGYDYVGETVADGSGHWSYTVASLPKDGSYIYQARATDAAGNEAVGSNDFAINLDTIAPVVPSIVKVEKPAGDEILQGKPTNTTTPTITGTSEKDAIINIYDVNGGWIGSTTADGQGHWSFTPTSQMPAGMHNLYTTATDAAGNVSGQSARFSFEINLQAPTIPTISRIENDAQKTINNDGYTNDHTPKLYGRGNAGTEITISVLIPGSKDPVVIGTAIVSPTGYWEFQAPYYAKDGLYKFIVTAKNDAGNVSDPSDYSVNLDFTPPAQPEIKEVRSAVLPKPGLVDDNGTTNDPAPMISGTAEKDSQVQIYVKGQADPYIVNTDSQGHWSFRIPGLDEGTYTFEVYSVDQAGNKSETPATRTVKILTSYPDAPAITGVYNDETGSEVLVNNNKYTKDATPVLHGTAKPGSIINIYDGTTLIGTTKAGDDKDGSWTFKIDPNHPLEDNQTHTFMARVIDDAGKEGNPSKAYVINVDHTAPDAPSIVAGRDTVAPVVDEFGNKATINDKRPMLRGEGAESYSTVKIYDGSNNEVGTVKADGSGQWKWTSDTDLKDGHYKYMAKVVDQAGNESEASAPFEFDVKTSNGQVPTISEVTNSKGNKAVTSDGVDWMNDDTLILHGTDAIKDSIVRIYDNGKQIGEVKAGPDGSWSFKTDPLIGQGHNFTAKTVDAAGNESSASTAHAFKVDTVAPNQPIVSRVENDSHTKIDDGGYTNSHAPKLYGRAEKNADVLVYGTLPGSTKPVLLGTVKANEDGYWEFQTPSYNTDGLYTFTVQAKDAAGNLSDKTDYSVNLDFVPPAQPVIKEVRSTVPPKSGPIDDAGTTNDPAPFITGEAEKNSQVQIYIAGQSEPIGVVNVDGQGHWSFRIPGLNDGNYSFEVYSVDQAGNKSQTPATYNITVMTSYPDAPAITGVYDNETGSEALIENNKYTKDSTPVLHGTAKPGSTINIYDGTTFIGTTTAGPAGSDGLGTWTFTVDPKHPLEDNQTHTLVARVVNGSGQESNPSKPWVVNVDHTAPDAPTFTSGRDKVAPGIDEFNNGATINDKQPVLRGEGAEAYSTVKIYDDSGKEVGTVKAGAGGQWTWTPDTALKDGHYKYTAQVIDQAGNKSELSAPFEFDVKTSNYQVPIIDKIISDKGNEPVAVDGVNWMNKDVVTIKGTGAIRYGIVRIYDNGKQIGEVTAGADGFWNFTTDTLIGSKHSFTAKSVDAAGNESPISNKFDIQIDTVAPNLPSITKYVDNEGVITGELDNHTVTNETQPILKGDGAEKGSVVTIYDTYNGTKTVIGTTIAHSDGTWEFDCKTQGSNATFGEGNHSITITSTDAAKNTSLESAPFEVTVDLTPPVNQVTITHVLDDQEPQTGKVLNNGYTNDRTPTLVGSNAEANGIVHIYVKNGDDYKFIGSTTANGKGDWSYTVAGLPADGSYTYVAKAADEAGNEAVKSNDFTINLDTTAPNDPTITSIKKTTIIDGKLQIDDIQNNLTNDSTPRLIGTAEKNSIITIYDGANNIGTTTADSEGNWYFDIPNTLPLEGRRYNFQITASDAAGNVSNKSAISSLDVNLTIPNSPNIIRIDDNVGLKKGKIANANDTGLDSFTDDTTPTIYGAGAIKGSIITIYDDKNVIVGTTTVTGEKGEWSFKIPGEPGYHLADGQTYEFFATCTNVAGNTSLMSSGYKFSVDTTPPEQPTLLSVHDNRADVDLGNDKPTRSSSLKLSGEGETGSTVYIYDSINGSPVKIGEATVVDGKWSFTADGLGNGSHIFTVRAVDEARNITSDENLPTWKVNVDNTVIPVPTIDKYVDNYEELNADGKPGSKEILNNGKTNDKTPVLEGTAADGIKFVRIYLNNSSEPYAEVEVKDGKWRYDFEANNKSLEDGINTIRVAGVGTSGFESDKSKVFTVDVHTTAPSLVTIDSAYVHDADNNINTIGTGRKTNDNTPMFSGRGESGNIIHLYDQNDKEIGTAKVVLGSWQIDIKTKLPNGIQKFYAIAEDEYGNRTTKEDAAQFELDIYNGEVAKPVIEEIIDQVGDGNIDKTGKIDSSVDGGLTNDRTPLLKGEAPAQGYKVSIFLNGSSTPIATVTAGENGKWSYQVGENLMGEGKNTFTVCYTDEYGNVSDESAGYDINLDYTPPSSPKISGVYDNVPDYVGFVDASGKTINDKSPEIRGTLTAGDGTKYVQVYINGIFHGTATIDSTTQPPSWSYKINSILNDGTYTVTTVGIDAAGNKTDVKNSGSFTFYVDTTPPQRITAISGAEKSKDKSEQDDTDKSNTTLDDNTLKSGSYVSDKTPDLIGITDYNTEVHIYLLSSDGKTWIDIGHVRSDAIGNWRFTVPSLLPDGKPLPEGKAVFRVKAVDDYGNWTAFSKGEFVLNIDTTPPQDVKISQIFDNEKGGIFEDNIPSNGITNDTKPVLTGTAEAGTILKIYDNGVEVATINPVPQSRVWSWQPSTDLSKGSHSFHIVATDKAGNTTETLPWTINVDNSHPNAPVISAVTDNKEPKLGPLADGDSTNDPHPKFSGTVTTGTTIKIYIDGVETTEQVSLTLSSDGSHYDWSWQPSKDFGEGKHTVRFVSINAAGNECEQPSDFSFVVDTKAPNKPMFSVGREDKEQPDVYTNDITNESLSGAAEVGSIITIYANGKKIGEVVVEDDGDPSDSTKWWFWEFPNLGEGDHEIYITVTDKAGNISEKSALTTVHYSATPPAPPTITDVYDDVGFVTGTVANGGRTDDKTPTIKGTGIAGMRIGILIDGKEVGYTTVNPGGDWSFTLDLSDGGRAGGNLNKYINISAQQTDEYGNSCSMTDLPWRIYVDTYSRPGYSDTAWKDAHDGVHATNESITLTEKDVNTVGLGNGKVIVYDGDNIIAQTDVDGAGHFTIIIPPASPNVWHKYTFGFVNSLGVLIKGGGSTGMMPDSYRGGQFSEDYYMWTDQPAPKPLLTMMVPYTKSNITTGAEGYIKSGNFATHGKGDLDMVVLATGSLKSSNYKVFIDGVEVSGVSVSKVNMAGSPCAVKLSVPQSAYTGKAGDHTIQVQYVADDGTKSDLSEGWHYTYVDGDPPAITIDSYINQSNGGDTIIGNGGITNKTRSPILTGKSLPNAVITIYDNGNRLDTTKADGFGNWSLPIRSTTLTDGTHRYTARQTDVEQYTSDLGEEFFITFDTTPPSDPLINKILGHEEELSLDHITNDSTPEIKGSAEAGSLVILYSENEEGKRIEVGRVQLAKGETSWSIKPNVAMTEGENHYVATATDALGNESAGRNDFDIIYDTKAPDAPKLEHVTNDTSTEIANGGYTNDQTPVFKGTAEKNSIIKFTAVFPDGTVKVLGTTTTDSIGDGNNGHWVFKVPDNMKFLVDGAYTIKITATDRAGNVNENANAEFKVNVDTTAPVKPDGNTFGVYDSDGTLIGWDHATADVRPTFKGQVADGDKVTIYDNGNILGVADVVNGAWSFTPTRLMEVKGHSITFRVSDKAGNVSDMSEPVNFTIDMGSPNLLRSADIDTHSADQIVDTESDEYNHTKADDSASKHETSEQGYSLNNLFSHNAFSRMSDGANDGQQNDKNMKVELDRSNLFDGSKGEINLDNVANLTGKEAAKHGDGADAEINKGLDSTIKPTETSPKLDELNLQVLDLKVANTGATDNTSATNNEMKNSDLEHLLHLQQSQVAG